jgi:hypothetical protein
MELHDAAALANGRARNRQSPFGTNRTGRGAWGALHPAIGTIELVDFNRTLVGGKGFRPDKLFDLVLE